MSPADLKVKAKEIAVYLKERWKVDASQESEVIFSLGKKKWRIGRNYRWRGKLIVGTAGDLRISSIHVSETRPSRAIALDIERRFMPALNRCWQQHLEEERASLEKAERRLLAMRKISEAGNGVLSRIKSGDGFDDKFRYKTAPFGIKVRIRYAGSVDLEIDSLDAQTGAEIVKFISGKYKVLRASRIVCSPGSK